MTQEIYQRLAGTIAADDLGRPLVLHHGTFNDFTEFAKSRDIGFHFGSRAQALRREREKKRELGLKDAPPWKIVSVALAVQKVLVYPDDPANWTSWHAVRELSRLVDVDFMKRMRRDGISDSRTAARHLRTRLVELGYDAIAYRNMFESDAGSVADWSWLVLDRASIVRLPDGTSDATLQDAVERSQGLDLPLQAIDIEGIRTRSGGLRFKKDRKALLDAITDLVCEAGGSVSDGPRDPGNPLRGTHEIDFGNGLTGEILLDIGRVRFRIPKGQGHLLSDIIDDLGSPADTRPPEYSLCCSWVSGEPLESFCDRIRGLKEEMSEALDLSAPLSHAI